MIKAGLERFSQGLAMELQDDKIAVNVLSPRDASRRRETSSRRNDPENPNLDFEPAYAMAKGTRWILRAGARVHRPHPVR
jgi:NAD(P)-dependent dehydrogenase (short-subunit alcohol dehydrogenase family)